MDFVELLKRVNRDLYDSCDKGALPKLARAIERSKGLAGLLKNNDAVLNLFPGDSLLKLSDVYHQYEAWKLAFRDTRRELATSKLNLPDTCLQNTAFPHELAALTRTARMCPRSGYADLNSWSQAVQAHLDLWNACLDLGTKLGTVSVSLVQPDHPEAEEFETYTFSNEKIADVKNYKWLGAKRGETANILSITISLPQDDIADQAAVHLPKLGMAAQKRDVNSVLEELVGNNLSATIRSLLDQRAQQEAIQTARNAYNGLLTTPPVEVEQLLSVYIGGENKPAGVVVLDKTGKMLNKEEVPVGGSLADAITDAVQSHAINTVVLPVSASDDERLRQAQDVINQLSEVDAVQILPAAIREAREKLSFPPIIGSAVVLGLRALRPTQEWTKVSPASIGLGEYSTDIAPKKLDAALAESRLFTIYQQRNRDPKGTRQLGQQGPRALKKQKRINPLLKTIRDLKPGMQVDGVVTNLTRFGAFVNIGLTTEAMIHVSQLSVDFVDEPSQVVRVGQTVNARVLEVVPEKSRIALSLKPAPAPGDRPERSIPKTAAASVAKADALFSKAELEQMKAAAPRPQHPRDIPQKSPALHQTSQPKQGGEAPKKSRHEALADLDALFKK